MKKFVTSTDRFSSLPEDIIHDHILSRLPTKDVKLMTCLSKTWYLISNSFPFLDFDHDFKDEDVHKYLYYVSRTLLRFRNLNCNRQIIRKLCITFTYHPSVDQLMNIVIALVLHQGVEELNLYLRNIGNTYMNRPCYNLPPSVFANSKIKVATFKWCSLLDSFPNPSACTIKKLHLEKVILNETTVRCIISSCPLIEDLSLFSCMGNVSCLRVSNLHKLKSLEIRGWWWEEMTNNNNQTILEIEIEAPSLHTLAIIGEMFKIRILGYYPVFTWLYLNYVKVEELELQEIVSRLPFLRRLSLLNVRSLTRLKLSSDTLNNFMVSGCNELLELQVDALNLLSVTFDFRNAKPLASSSTYVNVTSAQCSVSIYYHGLVIRTVEDYFVGLSNFVSKMKDLRYLNLCFSHNQNFSLEELKQRIGQPLAVNIDHLQLGFCKLSNIDLFLDGVLWSCHPRTLTIQLRQDDNNYAVKSICKIIMGHRGGCCSCANFARRSWLHRLQDVMHVDEDGIEERLSMDGTRIPYLRRSWGSFKFIFKC